MLKKNDKNILILFFKYPEKGKVKTRLARTIGEQQALDLYNCMLSDLYTTVENVFASKIVVSTKSEQVFPERCIYKNFLQEGSELGEKMYNAFQRVFSMGFSRAILTGGDCPEVTSEVFNKAFDALTDYDYVVGPAADGGYYFIGMTKEVLNPSVFNNISWSTTHVLEATIKILNSERYTYKLFEKLHDLDTFEDIETFFKRNRNHPGLETVKYLLKKRNNKNEI